MKNENIVVCVDFDGTIVKHEFPKIGEPVMGALPWLRYLQKQGIKLVLFTMRSDGPGEDRKVLSEAVKYLKDNGIELHGINVNPDQLSWTNSPKAYGQAYIDDAAIGCPLMYPLIGRPFVDWAVAGPLLLKYLFTNYDVNIPLPEKL